MLISNGLAAEAPNGSFANIECVNCHEKHNKELVAAWRTSAHGKGKEVASCVACHGNTHEGAATQARRDSACVDCHGGEKDPVVHSHATSKHGVIIRLEQKKWDWSQPLKQANYRAPGCAYCHMHQSNHNVSASVRQNIMDKAAPKEVQDTVRAVCQDCHAPRYITRLFDNGEAMLEIGRMKVREAVELLQQARNEFDPQKLAAMEQQLEKMRARHLHNVLLGIGHQSPDYQWWHGQPALDGDLLRIKGMLGELRRRQAIVGFNQDHKE